MLNVAYNNTWQTVSDKKAGQYDLLPKKRRFILLQFLFHQEKNIFLRNDEDFVNIP